MTAYKLIIVGLGGFLGSVMRYIIARFSGDNTYPGFPYGTFTVNIIGSFLLGIIYMLVLRKAGLGENARLFLGVGFCGGFTTFSAFALENFNMLQEKLIGTSLLYIGLSVAMGILALAAGVWVSRFI